MSRTQSLKVPQHVGGTDLRPVVALVPVPADDAHGGAEATDHRGRGKAGLLLKGALGTVLVAHLASAATALRDATSTPDLVWDTAGVAKKTGIAKIVLMPVVGPAAYTRDVKPKLDVARDALRLQGG